MKILATLLVLLCFCQEAFSLFGARPMGMGGAFTAVANDANAAYWNPAGLALNPEVSLTGSTLLNNRNAGIGDNVGNLKMSYETEMSPFEWIVGVGVASAVAYQGAQYLSDKGVLKTGWGREGEKTGRDESMAPQVKGTEEVVSLRETVNKALKTTAQGVSAGTAQVAQGATRNYFLFPYYSPWARPGYYRPRYWEPPVPGPHTKAQFALGLSWLNDYNPALDQNTNWYTLSLASGFEQRVALGGNINFYNLQKISSGIKGVGADLDIGFLARPVEYISVGLVTKGILTTDIKWQDSSSTRYEMLVNAGLAVQPLPLLTLAVDSHNILGQNNQAATMHYGAEVVVFPWLLVRGGLDDGSKTAGLTLALNNLTVDYALLGGSYLRTQMLGLTWRF